MAKRKIKKLILGILIILFALISVVLAFYYLEVVPELASREEAGMEELNKIEKQIEERVASIKDQRKDDKIDKGIKLESSIKKTKDSDLQVTKNKVEGLLWIDKRTSNFIITLGSKNGIIKGQILTVYEGENKLGQVKVKTVFDVISYVAPIDSFSSYFQGSYYRVISE